jgi:hypothetical protein
VGAVGLPVSATVCVALAIADFNRSVQRFNVERTAESVSQALEEEELASTSWSMPRGGSGHRRRLRRRTPRRQAHGLRHRARGGAREPVAVRIYNDEVTMVGFMAALFTFQPAMALLDSGVLDPEALLTHAFRLDDFGEALDTVRRDEGLKVQVLPNGELD